MKFKGLLRNHYLLPLGGACLGSPFWLASLAGAVPLSSIPVSRSPDEPASAWVVPDQLPPEAIPQGSVSPSSGLQVSNVRDDVRDIAPPVFQVPELSAPEEIGEEAIAQEIDSSTQPEPGPELIPEPNPVTEGGNGEGELPLPEEPPSRVTGEELPTVPLDDTLTPTPSEPATSPEALPPAVMQEEAEGAEGAESSTDEAEEVGDPELGILRLRERELSLRQPPLRVPVYLLMSASYLSNSNTRASEDPVDDQVLRSTVAVTASPILGRRTAAFATVQGSLFRYSDLSRLDYNELRFQAGVRHVVQPRVIGELGWTHRQLYFQEDGDRFLSDHAVFAALSRRDPRVLGRSTSLSSFYRVRASFADPKTSNRVVNSVGTTLSYDLTPRLTASLTGLAVLTNFTKQSRSDFYGQVLASLTYTLAKNTRLSLFSALNQGGSSDDRVDFDNALLGISFSSNLKLF